MFIISLDYQVPLEEVNRFIPEHIDYLNEQYDLGHFQLSGRKNPRTGGVILATLKDRKVLEEILTQDPFHRENIATYQVTEITPTKASKELAFLL
ncbi:YciI family protein [Vibrio palustris]|uniref:YCII-related domain protein n=1 Tax=Vibrio palustris TaxID=1918946 RepID=A0A1R4B6I9_9VIBR|nr:YciI family protein [Vibrio palustris]SJL84537.1 YCII-related domain protein [Vibrio palustris]